MISARETPWTERVRSALRHSWASETSSSRSWVVYAIFYLIIANIPYWVAAHEFGFVDRRGLFCLQFMTVGIVSLFIPRVLSGVLLILAMAADLICAVCESYDLSIQECLSNMGVYHVLTGHRLELAILISSAALLLGLSASVLRGLTVRRTDRRRIVVCLLAFAVFSISTDLATISLDTGRFPTSFRGESAKDWISADKLRPPRLTRISIIRLVRVAESDFKIQAGLMAGSSSPTRVQSATAEALRHVDLTPANGSQELPNLVVVVVESWGSPTTRRFGRL